MQEPTHKFSTPQAKAFHDALLSKGVQAELEYWDGHKTVDIAILPAKIYIEVDGLQHFVDPKIIMSDFRRSHYSDGDDFDTFYVTNQILDKYLEGVVDALVEVVNIKTQKI